MARRVDLKDQTPLIIKQENLVNGSCAVCRCGLSGAWPMCDGTHKATIGEEPDKLYRYERELPQGTIKRHEVGELEIPGHKQEEDHEGAREGRPGRRPEARAEGVRAGGTRGEAAGREGAGDELLSGGGETEANTSGKPLVTEGALATGGAESAVQGAGPGGAKRDGRSGKGQGDTASAHQKA